MSQCVKALAEAEAYPAHKLIIALRCINHGIQEGYQQGSDRGEVSVESGYWFRPPFTTQHCTTEGEDTLSIRQQGAYRRLSGILKGWETVMHLLRSSNPEKLLVVCKG